MPKSWIVTPDDLRKGELAQVGWHPAEIVNFEESEASDDAKHPGSTNVIFYFKIIDGDSKNVECRRYFNETAWGFAKDFFAAMKFPKDEKGNYKISIELFEQTVGHKIMIYIKRGKNKQTGSEFNDVVDFKPMAA
jgi:hypothetical protein